MHPPCGYRRGEWEVVNAEYTKILRIWRCTRLACFSRHCAAIKSVRFPGLAGEIEEALTGQGGGYDESLGDTAQALPIHRYPSMQHDGCTVQGENGTQYQKSPRIARGDGEICSTEYYKVTDTKA